MTRGNGRMANEAQVGASETKRQAPSAASSTAAAGDGDGSTAAPGFLAARSSVVRRPPPMKFGAIDVGTNSIHLVMAEVSPEGDFRILGRDKEMVQLGKGGFRDHVLTSRAITDGLAALQRFTKMARLKGVTRLKAFATSAVREAHNGGDFVNLARKEVDLELRIVSPEEEARLIYLAVRHAVPLGEGDNLIVDIGGGSVEIIVGNVHRPELLGSVKLGASRLAELFIQSDPPKESEIKALRRHIEKQLRPWVERIGPRRFVRLIGTSGTIRSIGGLLSPPTGRDGLDTAGHLHYTQDQLRELITRLSSARHEQRLKMPGMESRRVDMILPGVMLISAIMEAFKVDTLDHCDMGMREGIILDHIARNRAHLLTRAAWPDPRLRSVMQLAERCGSSREHAEKVAGLALSLFDQLQPLHRLPMRYRELLRFGAMLHDLGYHISHLDHHKHSYYLIRNGELKGFDDQEIEIIANIARYHRKERPKKSHYSFSNLEKAHRRAVRRLSVLLRIANALDRTHYSVVDAVVCRVRGGLVELFIHATGDAELELWTARRRAQLFEREFRMGLRINSAAQVEQEEAVHAAVH